MVGVQLGSGCGLSNKQKVSTSNLKSNQNSASKATMGKRAGRANEWKGRTHSQGRLIP